MSRRIPDASFLSPLWVTHWWAIWAEEEEKGEEEEKPGETQEEHESHSHPREQEVALLLFTPSSYLINLSWSITHEAAIIKQINSWETRRRWQKEKWRVKLKYTFFFFSLQVKSKMIASSRPSSLISMHDNSIYDRIKQQTEIWSLTLSLLQSKRMRNCFPSKRDQMSFACLVSNSNEQLLMLTLNFIWISQTLAPSVYFIPSIGLNEVTWSASSFGISLHLTWYFYYPEQKILYDEDKTSWRLHQSTPPSSCPF